MVFILMVMTKEALIARHVNFGTKINHKHIYTPHYTIYIYCIKYINDFYNCVRSRTPHYH
jgi:hypothetical protein